METILSFFEGLNEFCYTVEQNERLIDIAFKFSVNVDDIIAENNLKSEPVSGQIIFIKRGEYSVYTPLTPRLSSAGNDKISEKISRYPFVIVKK